MLTPTAFAGGGRRRREQTRLSRKYGEPLSRRLSIRHDFREPSRPYICVTPKTSGCFCGGGERTGKSPRLPSTVGNPYFPTVTLKTSFEVSRRDSEEAGNAVLTVVETMPDSHTARNTIHPSGERNADFKTIRAIFKNLQVANKYGLLPLLGDWEFRRLF